MANIQVTHSAGPNNARSESSVAVNPQNPQQLVSASKKFNNILTYDFTLAAQYSHDGGQTWTDSALLALPAGATVMTDPTLAWDDAGNVFLVGLTGNNPPAITGIGIVIYRSSDGGVTWTAPNPIHNSVDDDKQWAAGDSSPGSPHRGNIYAVWDDTGGIDFARTTDHGATWTGAGGNPAGGVIWTGSKFPEITVSGTGTVYVVAIAEPQAGMAAGTQIGMQISNDGGNSFAAAPNPASGIHPLENSLPLVDGWAEFAPWATFRVTTDPTVAVSGQTVLVAWPDFRDGNSRIYCTRSLDGGSTWDTPSGRPLTVPSDANFQHFHPQIVVDHGGVFACAFYELGSKPEKKLIDVVVAISHDGGATFASQTVTDQPWDPAVDTPLAHGNPNITFIGDYFGMAAAIEGFHAVWTDTRTGIQELFTTRIPSGTSTGTTTTGTTGTGTDTGTTTTGTTPTGTTPTGTTTTGTGTTTTGTTGTTGTSSPGTTGTTTGTTGTSGTAGTSGAGTGGEGTGGEGTGGEGTGGEGSGGEGSGGEGTGGGGEGGGGDEGGGAADALTRAAVAPPAPAVDDPVITVRAPDATSAQAALIEMSCVTPEAEIRYTTDLSDPDASSPRYEHPLELAPRDLPFTLKARAIAPGRADSRVVTRIIEVS